MKLNTETIRNWSDKKNLIPKLVSILLAVVLWGYLTSTKSGDIRFKLPLTYRNLDQTLTVSHLSNKYFMVRLKGRKDDLKSINSKNIKVFVDLSTAKVGEYNSFPVRIEKIDIPEELEVDVNPAEIKLYVEKKSYRNVPVVARASGDPEKGFVLGMIKVNPETVRIAGAANLITSIESLKTEYIFVNNKNSTFKTVVKIEKINEEEIDYNLEDVDVTVPIVPVSDTAVVELPLAVKNRIRGYDYRLAVEKVTADIIIQHNKPGGAVDLSAYVDAYEIPVINSDIPANGRLEKEAVVHVRGGLIDESGVLSIKPEKVKVIITRE